MWSSILNKYTPKKQRYTKKEKIQSIWILLWCLNQYLSQVASIKETCLFCIFTSISTDVPQNNNIKKNYKHTEGGDCSMDTFKLL